MAKKGGYVINNLYQGGYSTMSPSQGEFFTGYHIPAGELGAPTKVDTANQIQQVGQLLNQGIIPIEVGSISPEIFDQIPKQQFKEIRRMSQLTGAKISVHAPIIEPSGIDPEGRMPWDESKRELAERQLNEIVEKSIDLDKKGGVPIVIHSTGIPGTEYTMTPEGKKQEGMAVINKEKGTLTSIQEERHFDPGSNLEQGDLFTVQRQLNSLNHTEWANTLRSMEESKKQMDEITGNTMATLMPLITEYKKDQPLQITTPQQEQALKELNRIELFQNHIESSFNAAFSRAWQFSDKSTKEKLKQISNQWIKDQKELIKQTNPITQINQKSQLLQNGLERLRDLRSDPQVYVPVEDFALEQSSKTFANIAFNAFDKHKNKAPILSVENFFPGTPFAYGEGMEKLILESRKKFVEKAIEKGYSKTSAQQQAEKLIGMTLDVGHLNVAKKKGFKNKDLKKEVEKIAPYVKHIHLTDNFGYSDSHLAPGMGNVPTKEILEELEKAGTLEDSRKIIEAVGVFQHLGVSPLPYTLSGMGSPIYKEGVGPYWNQTSGLYQGYSTGLGNVLPQINYETFGAGFSQLPLELGGQRPGAEGSRMSGRQME